VICLIAMVFMPQLVMWPYRYLMGLPFVW